MKNYTITKRFTKSLKYADGTIECFATELTTTVEVASGEELVAASDKLFTQAQYLTEQDIANTINKPVQENV